MHKIQEPALEHPPGRLSHGGSVHNCIVMRRRTASGIYLRGVEVRYMPGVNVLPGPEMAQELPAHAAFLHCRKGKGMRPMHLT